jgi:hypothetical protein
MASKRRTNNSHQAEVHIVRSLDALADYDSYTKNVAPKLRRAVDENWGPEKIYKEFGSMVAAKVVSCALLEPDTAKSVAASKEVLDRALGKPKERVENTHKYAALPDSELDQLLRTTLEDMKK